MALRKLKQESPGKILQKAEDSRAEGGLARLAHVNYVVEYLNNLGKTTYVDNAAALADGKKPGDIIAITSNPGYLSPLAVVVEAIPVIMADVRYISCVMGPGASPDVLLSDAEVLLLITAMMPPLGWTSFWLTDTEPPEFIHCYVVDPTYVAGTLEQNTTALELSQPGLTGYADCTACEAAHPPPP